MSQRARILWAIALVVLPLALLDAVRIGQNYSEDRDGARAERLRLVETAALSLQVFIESNAAALMAVALHPELAPGRATPELRALLERVMRDRPDWVGLGVVGSDGISIMSTLGGPTISLADRPYFRQAIASGQAVLSSAIVGRVTGRTNVVIAAPFELRGGGRGVLVAPLPIEVFAGRLLPTVRPPGAALAVADGEAQLVVHSELPRGRGLVSWRAAPGVANALGGERGTVVAQIDGAEQLVAYAPVQPHGWAVLALEPASSVFAVARRELTERAAVLAVMLALVAALAWYLSGQLATAYRREVQARTQLERAVRTRDDFLAAASHDLRNPLAAVRSANDLLRLSLQRGGAAAAAERLQTCVAHIDSATRRMASLIDAFLDMARLQTGAPLDLALGEVDLTALLREIAEEARLLSSRHRVALEAPPRLVVRADAERLRRAVANLVNNAVKYSPGGGDVGLRLERSGDGGWAIVTVTDTGIGIPPGEFGDVFERFRRGSNVIGRIAGTGIGLAGARQIVEQHGGAIEVDSRLGAGSTFTVRIPCPEPGEPAQREAA